MNLAQPQNAKVLKYLSRNHRVTPAFAPCDSAQDAYFGCGCHPEIVERVWDQIGKVLPADCRCFVHGTPALAHPKAGIILATVIGTQYGLRLPGSIVSEAIRMGAKTHVDWTGGGHLDIQRDLGEDWVFGSWLAEELIWCRQVYEGLERAL